MVRSREGVSDLLFTPDKAPLIEAYGVLEEFPLEPPVLRHAQIEQLIDYILGDNQRLRDDLSQFGSCDCSYSIDHVARFRVNTFRQNGRRAVVMRKLQSEVPTLEMLGLPAIFGEIVKEKNGIVLVTGASGSGKTSLAMNVPASRPVRPMAPAMIPWCLSTFMVPSTNTAIIAWSRTRGAPISGVKAGTPSLMNALARTVG